MALPSPNRDRSRPLLRAAALLSLLALLLVQMAASSVQKSAAFDETYHLVSGYAYLHTGDPRLSWEHPPLVQVLAALPLLIRDDLAPFPFDQPAWQMGDGEAFVDDYLWVDNHDRAPELIWAGRWPLMGLTLLFGLALFAAIRATMGERAAWVGLLLFALDPNVVAGGRLISNDLAMAGFMLVAVWRLGAYLRHPTGLNLVAAGLAAGLAGATKVASVVLAPVFLLVALVYRPPEGHALPWWRRLLALVGMAVVAAVTIWGVFSFRVGPLTEGGIPLPAPTFLRGLPGIWRRVARGTPTFLFGRTSDTGWWYYFPIVFLLKTPLPTLILLGIGLVGGIRRWRERAVWWIPAAFYLLVASASTLQIGYRYILPVLLFSIPLAAGAVTTWPRGHIARVGLALLCAWAAVEAALIFPDHISYVNELGGGPDNGWRIFADMNVDWGQDLVALERYLEAHPSEDVRLAYFGSAYPSAYGIDARLLPSFSRHLFGPEVAGFNDLTPPPGTYAISATSLHLGLIYRGEDIYAFFRDRAPDDIVGRSILIYQVDYPPGTPIDRAVVVGPDVSSLRPEALGHRPGHRLVAKWADASAFVLPGRGPARAVVERAVPDVPLVAEALAAGSEFEAGLGLADLPADGVATDPDGSTVPLPARFEGGPALGGWSLSSEMVAPGETVTVVTYWRIGDPISPPLAVFVHLLGPDGQAVTQWDGWPVATQGLETGDVVVVSHPLVLPSDVAVGSLVLQVGLYRPPHGPRLPVAGGDRLILGEVGVRR